MKNKRILVVDDNKEFLSELSDVLSASGYEMSMVDDARDALATALRVRPDVALLDLKMQGLNGFELADEIKRTPGLENTSIIAMSAFFSDEYFPLLNMCGVERFLKKPFELSSLINMLEQTRNSTPLT